MKQPRHARKPASADAITPAAPPPPPRPSPLDKIPERLDVWLVFAAALLVRLLHIAVASRTNPSFDIVLKGFDQFTYQNQARMILDGDWLLRQVGLFYYSPLYAYFSALVQWVVGHQSYLALHLIQAFTGALTCSIGFLLARTWLSRSAALFAALAYTLLATWLFYEQELLHEGFMLLFYTTMLWGLRTAQLGRRGRAARLVLAGAAGMLAMIGRGNAALVLAAMVPWVALAVPSVRPLARRFNFLGTLAFAAGVALILVPLLVRNHAAAGRWSLGMGNGRVLFYIGNNSQSNGEFVYSERFLEIFNKVGQVDTTGAYRKAFLEDLRGAPGPILFNMLRKTVFFFAARDLPDNLNFQLGRRLIPTVGWTPVQWEWLVPLGLVGLGLSLGLRRQWSLLWLFTAVFSASLILIIPIGRYRQPVLIPLVIWAAFALEQAVAAWRARNYAVPAGCVGAFVLLLVMLWPVDGPFIRWNDYQAATDMALRRHKTDMADRLVREGLESFPGKTQLMAKAFEVAQARGQRDEMERLGEVLLQRPQLSPLVALGMVELDIEKGNLQRAQMILASMQQSAELMKDPELQPMVQAAADKLNKALQAGPGPRPWRGMTR